MVLVKKCPGLSIREIQKAKKVRQDSEHFLLHTQKVQLCTDFKTGKCTQYCKKLYQ